MSQLVEFKLDDETVIVAEVEEQATGQLPVGRSRLTVQAVHQFDQALSTLAPVVSNVIDQMKKVQSPDEIAIEFGFKLSANLGAIIAKTESEGNFKLALKWKADS